MAYLKITHPGESRIQVIARLHEILQLPLWELVALVQGREVHLLRPNSEPEDHWEERLDLVEDTLESCGVNFEMGECICDCDIPAGIGLGGYLN